MGAGGRAWTRTRLRRDVSWWKVGRVWRYEYTGKVSGEMARWLWHSDRRNVEGPKDASGHCGSLHETMAQFRTAWDAPADNVRNFGP